MARAYYNEIEPYAAEWLRRLIDQGHIAPGDVDDRDIRDLKPEDLAGYTQCHFFAGIGAWSLALRRAGWADDVPVWTGSCPCQPFSAAGAGAGFDDERHLWPYWFWLIQERRPPALFGEQVASSHADPWVDLVQDDLEALGYAFGAVPFPAASVGAPNMRDRLYWVAYADRQSRQQGRANGRGRAARSHALQGAGPGGSGLPDGMGYADSTRSLPSAQPGVHRSEESSRSRHGKPERPGCASGLDDADLPRLAGRHRQAQGEGAAATQPGIDRGLADPNNKQSQGAAGDCEGAGKPRREGTTGGLADADGGHAGAERQQPLGQFGLHQEDGSNVRSADPGPRSAAAGDPARSGPVNGFWRAADWLLCRDGKWRPVEPGTFPLAHGAAARVGRLRAYGNAVNAQAAQLFIEEAMQAIGG